VQTYDEFLLRAAARGEVVNTIFEERLFSLVASLRRITDVLAAGQIAYEVIGGLAVLIHVEEANPEYSALTRDVDLMVRREDLERIKEAAAKGGFRFRHAAGLDMLIHVGSVHARDAIHLVFSEERVRPADLAPTPPLNPVKKNILGTEVMVVPVADLLRMKLTAFRLKDQVHVKALEACGLITAEIESRLLPELLARLNQVRQTE
jgi:hypothetical protein